VKLPLGPSIRTLLESTAARSKFRREGSKRRDGVIFFDVSDMDLEGYNKFIPYLLHRNALFRELTLRGARESFAGTIVESGDANQELASLAEKFGGGGHRRRAISFEREISSGARSRAAAWPHAARKIRRIFAGRSGFSSVPTKRSHVKF